MENKKVQNMSKLGLAISLLPLLTLIPVALNIKANYRPYHICTNTIGKKS